MINTMQGASGVSQGSSSTNANADIDVGIDIGIGTDSIQPTPIDELERMLNDGSDGSGGNENADIITLPLRSSVTKRVSEKTPTVNLLLRPHSTETEEKSEIRLPSASSATVQSSSSDAPTTAAVSDGPVQSRICASCHRQYSRYVCPRCNLNTCSLACYKLHNVSCTHAFSSSTLANEQALESSLRAGLGRTCALLGKEWEQHQQEKRRTKELVERVAKFHEEGDRKMEEMMHDDEGEGDDEDEDSEEARKERETQERLMAALSLLDKVDTSASSSSSSSSGSERILSNSDLIRLQSLLPKELLEDFQRSVIDGRMSRWVGRWKAWWTPRTEELEVERADDEDAQAAASTSDSAASSQQSDMDLTPDRWSIPAVQFMDDEESLQPNAPPLPDPSAIPAFHTLFPGRPSPLLPVHLFELLCAYACIIRLYNGEPETEPATAVDMFAMLAPLVVGTTAARNRAASATAASAQTAASSSPVTATPASPPTANASSPSSASSSSSPSSSPSLMPTSDTVEALQSSLSHFLSASRAPPISATCCWILSRLGDAAQIATDKRNVLRVLAHIRTLVQKAIQEAKQPTGKLKRMSTSQHQQPSPSTTMTLSSSSALPLPALSRKLLFFLSFVASMLQDHELRAWNHVLYQSWQVRWEEHQDFHRSQTEMKEKQAKERTNAQLRT